MQITSSRSNPPFRTSFAGAHSESGERAKRRSLSDDGEDLLPEAPLLLKRRVGSRRMDYRLKLPLLFK
jgi:hypothetical protein